MRKPPGLDQILAQAEKLAGGPTFRFHGNRNPKDHQRVPVAYGPSTKVLDGVAKLRLYEPIDSWGGPWGISASEFAQTLDDMEGDFSEIRLHINCPGGEVWEGLAIMNTLAQHDAKVVAVVDGLAASAASFIAASADEVIMGRNTQLMIHDALGLCIGQAVDMHEFGDFLAATSDNIASIYAAKAGGSTADWRAAMVAETWYTGEEAVAAGLADSVMAPPAKEDDAAATDRWDLSIFAHAGREDAPDPNLPKPVVDEVPDLRVGPGGIGTGPARDEETDRILARMQERRHAANARRVGA